MDQQSNVCRDGTTTTVQYGLGTTTILCHTVDRDGTITIVENFLSSRRTFRGKLLTVMSGGVVIGFRRSQKSGRGGEGARELAIVDWVPGVKLPSTYGRIFPLHNSLSVFFLTLLKYSIKCIYI